MTEGGTHRREALDLIALPVCVPGECVAINERPLLANVHGHLPQNRFNGIQFPGNCVVVAELTEFLRRLAVLC